MRSRRRARRPADGPAPTGAAGRPSVMHDRAPDDTDIGWGELPSRLGADENDVRLLEDRPPHHAGN